MHNPSKKVQWNKLQIHYIPATLSLAAVGLLLVTVFATGLKPAGVWEIKPQFSSADSQVFSASPNPVQVCNGSGVGNTTLSWTVPAGTKIELRKDGASGQLLREAVGFGNFQATNVTNNSNYYLYSITIGWKYIRGQGWVKVPTQDLVGRVTIVTTQQGCNSSGGGGATTTTNKIPIANATASSSASGSSPSLVYDGNPETTWNSGGFAGKQLMLDLGTPQIVAGVRLRIAQSPAGATVHEIYAGAGTWPNQTKIHTFSQITNDGQWLEVNFSSPLQNTRYITISTTQSPSWVAWREVEVLGNVPVTAHVPYFGYFASAVYGVGNGNYTKEIADHSNLAWISGDWANKLQQARANNMKAVVAVYWHFFDHQTLQLRPDHVQLWNQIVQRITPYQNDIAAFNIIDEPFHYARSHGIPDATVKASIEQAIALIRQSFPNIPQAVFFAYTETDDNLVIPSGFDWVGVDCYGPFDNCYGKSIPEYYNILKSKMTASQRLMVIPQSYWPATSGVGEMEQVEIIRRAQDYYNFVATEPLTVAVVPFLWQSFEGGTGARDLPRVQNWFRQMGKNVSGK